MRRNFFLLVAIFSLIFSTLACSSFLGGDDKDTATESPGATEEVVDQPDATETPEFEEGTIDLDSIWDTMDIQSYRGDFTMTFDGTKDGENINGSITMTIEHTSQPPAQHLFMTIEGYEIDPELEGFDTFEFYVMEDMAYMNMGMGVGWMAFPNDPEDSISDEFMIYEDFVDLPEKANRKLLPENVNGVMAWHYVIDEDDLTDEFGEYDEVSADVWIAVDGGYLIKMDFTMSGSFTTDELGDQPIDEGTMSMVFNMLDVNSDFTIELPPDAAAAEPFTLDDDLFGDGEWTREDVPLPDDAEIDFAMEGMVTAYTNLSYEEALDFMLTQLEANGWTIEGEPWETEDSYWGQFVKEGETLDLSIDPAFDGTERFSIMITID